jgi:hypothetical protein
MLLEAPLVSLLVRIGTEGSSTEWRDDPQTNRLIGEGTFMRSHVDWERQCARMRDREVEALIRSLVIVEQTFPSCYAGSTSPAQTLLRYYAKRKFEPAEKAITAVAEWIFGNCSNSYVVDVAREINPVSRREASERLGASNAEKSRLQHDQQQLAAEEAKLAAKLAKIQERNNWNLQQAIERKDMDAIRRWLREGANPNALEKRLRLRDRARELGLDEAFD